MNLNSFSFIILFFSLTLPTFALKATERESNEVKTFSLAKTEKIRKRAQQLKVLILDYENYCESGCPHTVDHVEEMKILQKIGTNQMITWTHVKQLKETKSFAIVKVQERKPDNALRSSLPQVLTISSSFPSAEQIESLEHQFNLDHDSLFNRMDATWTLKEFFDAQGSFLYTQVDYNLSADSDSRLLRTFDNKAQNEMEKTAEQLFEILSK